MPYINLQEASEATGKSVRTIRRLCNSPQSKKYITYEDGKLLVEVSYLAKNYPLINSPEPVIPPKNDIGQTHAMASQTPVPDGNPQNPEKLLHEIELLKLELRHQTQITQEKEQQIDILKRSLLMLGEGQRKEPAPEAQPDIPEQEPLPVERKKAGGPGKTEGKKETFQAAFKSRTWSISRLVTGRFRGPVDSILGAEVGLLGFNYYLLLGAYRNDELSFVSSIFSIQASLQTALVLRIL